MSREVVVVGGGFSGLVTAYYLKKKGLGVTLYEKRSDLGGLIKTTPTEYGLVESAASGLLDSENIQGLFKDLRIEPIRAKKAARYIFRGRARRWPLGFTETLSFGLRLTLQKARGGFKTKPGESLDAWGVRVLGLKPTQYLLFPALQGIYGPMRPQMSAGLILDPILNRKKGARYRGMVAPPEGMGQLIQKLKSELIGLGVHIYTNKDFAFTLAPQIPHFICVGLNEAVRILSPLSGVAASRLSQGETQGLITTTVFYPKNERGLKGFGCLFPVSEGFYHLGVLCNHHIFDHRSDQISETWITGGTEVEVNGRTDQEILTHIKADREKLLKTKTEPLAVYTTRWPKGLPQYNLKLEEGLRELQLPPNIFLCGNYLGGIGLTRILDRVHDQIGRLS